MRIETKFSRFIIQEDETLQYALDKINRNKSRILFVVSSFGELLGSLSDGDVRRWLVNTSELDLSIPVKLVMNKNCSYVFSDINKQDIKKKLTEKVIAIPLVDKARRVVSIALREFQGFWIGDRLISDDLPSFIIAEIGNNHQGDLALAKKLVDLAKDSGADCAKFQLRDLASLYTDSESNDLGAEYTKDLLSKFSLSTEEMLEVFDYCKKIGMEPLCTPWDLKSLEVLEKYGMKAYKVASADFTNHELLAALCNTKKPLICSTGMSTESEIKQSIAFLDKHGANYVILHCNSTYPTPFKDVNLAYLPRLKNLCDGLVGYSGHERGISVPLAAIALGAKVIEKHFTIDRSLEGNDHKVSLLPKEFTLMVRQIREIEESIGSNDERVLTQGEMLNRENLAKSLVATRAIKSGQEITPDMIEIKSPGQGLQPNSIYMLIGRVAKRNIQVGDYFYESDLSDEVIEARIYDYKRPFGIPVRYHDYSELSQLSNLDFVEFHLSYKDMEMELDEFFTEPQEIGFAVHSPELFSNDHIMDLASEDIDYRKKSIDEMSKVIKITKHLKKYFPKTENPVVVINAGGFDSSGFVKPESKQKMYERVGESLKALELDGVEIAIQTMPPFPWHFGGQSFHNLFISADEIVDFCERYSTKICLDVSHTQMACNYYNWSLSEFVRKVGKYIVHIHVVDAEGTDGEGVEVGKGDVDFAQLARDLNEFAPKIQFIPEVWQGHKNRGEGFWKALEYLEKYKL
ncbi:N-acetylneuraminate synthase family protein [Saccharospirillum sp.]|uniref:N-acetylneuraminate synthase family protein n=1 Tax=Saccharospirillum sp. TaxID=2033801 RepID=UPI00329A2B82